MWQAIEYFWPGRRSRATASVTAAGRKDHGTRQMAPLLERGVEIKYCLDEPDEVLKRELFELQAPLLCVHGNHEGPLRSSPVRKWSGTAGWCMPSQSSPICPLPRTGKSTTWRAGRLLPLLWNKNAPKSQAVHWINQCAASACRKSLPRGRLFHIYEVK